MKKIMKNALLIGGFLVLLLHGLSLQATNAEPCSDTQVENIIIEVQDFIPELTWTPMAGNTAYQVNVFDLTSGQPHSQASTFQTSITVPQITPGHRYLFSVSRGATTDYIIIDIIDL